MYAVLFQKPVIMADQQFCLRWNNHQSTLISVFDSLLERGAMVDCTLAAEGQCLQAHKVVLSACSPYLEVCISYHFCRFSGTHEVKDLTFLFFFVSDSAESTL